MRPNVFKMPLRPLEAHFAWAKRPKSSLRNPLNLRQSVVQAVAVLLVATATAQSAPPDLRTLRHLYAAAVQEEIASDRFLTVVRAQQKTNAVGLGYRGVAEAVQAQYLWSPLARLRAVREAHRWFGGAVALDPQNVEVRFLRFSVETHVPRYLGLSPHLADDRALILRGARGYASLGPSLGLDGPSLRLIRDFMLRYGECTPEETQMLRRLEP